MELLAKKSPCLEMPALTLMHYGLLTDHDRVISTERHGYITP